MWGTPDLHDIPRNHPLSDPLNHVPEVVHRFLVRILPEVAPSALLKEETGPKFGQRLTTSFIGDLGAPLEGLPDPIPIKGQREGREVRPLGTRTRDVLGLQGPVGNRVHDPAHRWRNRKIRDVPDGSIL